MTTNAHKIANMKDHLDEEIAKVTLLVMEEGSPSVPLAAGLALARVWLQDCADEGYNWAGYLDRLVKGVNALTNVADGGHPTNFGLWDGLNAALSWATDISMPPASPA